MGGAGDPVCSCLCVDARRRLGCLPQLLSTGLSEADAHWIWSSASLASQALNTGVIDMTPPGFSMWELETEFRSACLHALSTEPSPQLWLASSYVQV